MVFVVMMGVYLPTATWDHRVSVDTAFTALPAWTFSEFGTLDLSPIREYAEAHDAGRNALRDVDGTLLSGRNPGAIWWAVPFYLAARPITSPVPFPIGPSAAASAVAAALSVAMLHLTVRTLLAARRAMLAALAFGTATATWAVPADALWTHGPAQLAAATAMCAVAYARTQASGIGFGLGVLCRPDLVVPAALSGSWLAVADRRIGPALQIGLPVLLGVAVLTAYSRAMFGTWSVLAGYQVFATDFASQLVGAGTGESFFAVVLTHLTGLVRVLADIEQGLFVYSPSLVPLLFGLRRAWHVAPVWVRAFAVSGVAHLVVQVVVHGWWAGDFFFGYRYPLEGLTLAAPLLVLSWREWIVVDTARRRLFGIMLSINVAWMGYGAILEPYK